MKRTLLSVCLLALLQLTLFAQTGQNPRIVHIPEKSAIHVPPQEALAGLKWIYGNLNSAKTELYNDQLANYILGPNNSLHYVAEFQAMSFTPKSDSHVSRVRVAVQYRDYGGANQVDLSIYGDSGGVPGTLLAGPVTVTNLPVAGTCCTLTVANFPPVAVTGGTQYWVVADTPLTGTGSDFVGVWNFIFPRIPPQASYLAGSGWSGFSGYTLEVAGEVLGTIP